MKYSISQCGAIDIILGPVFWYFGRHWFYDEAHWRELRIIAALLILN